MAKIHRYSLVARRRIAAAISIVVGIALLALLLVIRIADNPLHKGKKPVVIKAFYTTLVDRAQSSFGAK
jgi:hypothetical protein